MEAVVLEPGDNYPAGTKLRTQLALSVWVRSESFRSPGGGGCGYGPLFGELLPGLARGAVWEQSVESLGRVLCPMPLATVDVSARTRPF